MQAGQVAAVAQAVAARLGVQAPQPSALPARVPAAWLDALARDLQANRGRSLVMAGDGQPAAVHALAHAMNAALGNVGQTVVYTEPVLASPTDTQASLRELVQDMAAGRVNTLLILGANPAYTAPADLDFAGAYGKVGLRIHVGLYQDETAALSHWHIPETHFLEAWSDVRAFDGTAAIIQPLIEPLYGGRSAHEILALFSDQPLPKGYDIVRTYWQGQHKGATSRPGGKACSTAASCPIRRCRHHPGAQHRADRRRVSQVSAGGTTSGASAGAWRSSSGLTPASGMGDLPITPGCRSCPSR